MTLTLGDIRPQWGQGLVFSRRTRTATCAASISRNHTATSPGDRASYDARIYDFEPDVWGGTRLLTLSGPGLNRGIRLAWAKKHIRLATRYSYHRTSSWSVQIDLRS